MAAAGSRCHVQMPDPIHQIDYAPPTGRPAWWNRRTGFILILLLAAAVSAVIVVPRVTQRARLLSLQSQLSAPGGTNERLLTRMTQGQLSSAVLGDESWREYEKSLSGIGSARKVFSGMRQASEASPQRLLVLLARVHSTDPWDTEIFWLVIKPATWTSRPEVVAQGAVRHDLPLPAGGSVVVRPSKADDDPARVALAAEHASVPLEGLIMPNRSQIDATALIVGHLLPDDTVTLDWKPAPAGATTQPRF